MDSADDIIVCIEGFRMQAIDCRSGREKEERGEIMKKSRVCFIGLLLLAAVLCLTVVPGRAYAATASVSSGAAKKSGLVKIKKKYYYLKNGKKIRNTWKKVKGSKYYFGKKGAAATGSTKIKGTYYVFSTKGKLLTGKGVHVKKVSGKYYQIDKKGRAKSGWDKKQVYCYAKNGARITKGWSTDKKYYLDEKGKKAKGIVVTGGLVNAGTDDEKWVDPKFAALDENTGIVDKALTNKLNELAQYEKDFAPLKELIGEPEKATYTTGCYYGPEVNGAYPYAPPENEQETYKGDGHLVYDGFEIDTYRAPDGTEFFIGFAQDF